MYAMYAAPLTPGTTPTDRQSYGSPRQVVSGISRLGAPELGRYDSHDAAWSPKRRVPLQPDRHDTP